MEYKWIPYLIGVIFSFLVACTQFLLDFAPYLDPKSPWFNWINPTSSTSSCHVIPFFFFFFLCISEFQLLAVWFTSRRGETWSWFLWSWGKCGRSGNDTTRFYLALILQIVLIYLGKKRKLTGRTRIQFLLWCPYLMADWVATVALGALLNNLGEVTKDMGRRRALNVDTELAAFWAPFLLFYCVLRWL